MGGQVEPRRCGKNTKVREHMIFLTWVLLYEHVLKLNQTQDRIWEQGLSWEENKIKSRTIIQNTMGNTINEGLQGVHKR